MARMKRARKKTAPAGARQRRPAARRKAAPVTAARRADFGAPIDGFIARQPAHLRALLEELRALIEAAAPDAEASLKWGIPNFTVDGAMMCALGAHKAHVNLILAGPPGAFADREGRLQGEGKTGRHLRLTSLGDLPRDAVRAWLRTAAELAREKR